MLRSILYLSILTFTIVVISLVTTVYHNATTSTISQDIGIQITPIPSGFDLDTATSLRVRTPVPAGDLSEKFVSSVVATPTRTPNTVPVASGSAPLKKNLQTQSATSSAQSATSSAQPKSKTNL